MHIIEEVLNRLTKEFPAEEDIIKFEDERGDSRHFALSITSDKFEGLNRVKRSQFVYAILLDLIKNDNIHALKLNLKTHSE